MVQSSRYFGVLGKVGKCCVGCSLHQKEQCLLGDPALALEVGFKLTEQLLVSCILY